MDGLRAAKTKIARFQGELEAVEDVLRNFDEEIEELRQGQNLPDFETTKRKLWEKVKEKELQKKVFESQDKMLESEILKEERELGFDGSSRLGDESLQNDDERKAKTEGKLVGVEWMKEYDWEYTGESDDSGNGDLVMNDSEPQSGSQMQNGQPLPSAFPDQLDTESSIETPIARQTPDSSVLSKSMSTTSDADIAPTWIQRSLRRLSKWIKTRKILRGVRQEFLLNSCKYILRLGRRKLVG